MIVINWYFKDLKKNQEHLKIFKKPKILEKYLNDKFQLKN